MKSLRILFSRFPSPQTPEEVEEAKKRTFKISVWEGSVWSLMAGFGDTYISPFAIFLKASNQAIGFLSTMPSLIGAFAQTLGASLTDRMGRRRALIVPLCILQALCFIPMFVVPFYFREYAVPAVILFAALGIFAGHMAAPAWISLMGDVVPANRRGDQLGYRARMIILMVFLSILAAGGTLYLCQMNGRTWMGFGILFAVACLARLISARLLALHYDPEYHPTKDSYFSFWDFIRRLPYSNFTKFSLYSALMMGACSVAGPFFNVYMLKDLHWSYAQFTINAAAFQMTQFFLIRWWGRMGDRYGNRVILVATGILQPILPFMWTVSTNYFYLVGVQIFAGAVWAGFSIAAQNFTYDAVTPPKRARISAYMTVINGLFTLIGGAVIGAWLADSLPKTYEIGPYRASFISPLPAVFILSGLLRAVVAATCLPIFKEVRQAEPIHPVALIFRLSGGEALSGFFWQVVEKLNLTKGKK